MVFSGNHVLLSGGFVLVVVLIIASEIAMRLQGFSQLSTAAAVQMINRENAQVIDISSQADFTRGHIASARHIAASQLEKSGSDTEKLRQNPVLLVCKSGQTATGLAAKLLKMGYPQVAVLKGWRTQWKADNYPTVTGK